MSSLTAELKLRPTRIGFLVRPSDLTNLRSVFKLCSCLWGGYFNPIIPVCRKRPVSWRRDAFSRPTGRELAMGYIRFYEPDVFVETESGLAKTIGIQDDTQNKQYPRVLPLNEFIKVRNDRNPEFAYGLSILNVYREIYRTEYQFVRRQSRFVAIIQGRSSHGAFLDASFGGLPRIESLRHFRTSYDIAFEPEVLTHSPTDWLRLINDRGFTPLTFTKHGLKQRSYHEFTNSLFVVNPTSPVDLIDFWNLRLMRRNVLAVSSEWLPETSEFLCELIRKNHRPIPGNPNDLKSDTVIELGSSVSTEKMRNRITKLFKHLPSGSWSLKPYYDNIWIGGTSRSNDSSIHPVPIQVECESLRQDLQISNDQRPSIEFQSLSPDFAPDFTRARAGWVNTISLSDFFQRHRYALTLPYTPISYFHHLLRIADPLIVSREGFVLLQQNKHETEYIELLPNTDAIIDRFQQVDIEATESDIGRLANQILSSIGGFRGIRLIQDEETLRLLDMMSKSTRIVGDGTIEEEYSGRTASIDQWQSALNRREKTNFGPKGFLDRLVDAGALKLGLSISCPNCKQENWYGLSELNERLVCERCLESFKFPQGRLDFKNTPWKFRVAGPFSVPNYANGSYATLLAVNCMLNGVGYHNNTITFSTNLNLKINGRESEVDFACWYQRGMVRGRRDEPRFLIGEAKSFAQNSFTDKDINRLKRVGKHLPGTFLVLATLKSDLSPEEKKRIIKLANWGRIPDAKGQSRNLVIVLTGIELFAQRGILHAWENTQGKRQTFSKKGHRFFDNLITLADITQQVYLGLQPLNEWLHHCRNKPPRRESVLRRQKIESVNL